MMRITSFGKECFFFLEQSSNALLSERVLVAWTRLLIIADEIGGAFAFDDHGEMASMFDVRTQLMMDSFKLRLSQWRSYYEAF